MAKGDAVHVEGLVKEFGNVKALDGLDLVVPRGQVVGLLGPNGSGKTTTVRILATLLKPTKGIAYVNGFNVEKQADQVRHSIGLTGQYAAVDEFLTGRENLRMFGDLYHLAPPYVKQRSQELLEWFDLIEAADRPAQSIGWNAQAPLVGQSLIAKPRILFLDEPTTGLDPRSRLGMWGVIESLVAEGTTVLLTTQYLEEADKLADDIVVIDHGRVIAHGTAEELKDQIGGDRIEVTVTDLERIRDAQTALAPVFGGESMVTDSLVSGPVSGGSTVLVDVVRLLDSQNIAIADLALRRPTLDDVFLSLTGHGAVEENSEKLASRTRKGRKLS